MFLLEMSSSSNNVFGNTNNNNNNPSVTLAQECKKHHIKKTFKPYGKYDGEYTCDKCDEEYKYIFTCIICKKTITLKLDDLAPIHIIIKKEYGKACVECYKKRQARRKAYKRLYK
jgi:hypothetical protein